MITTIWRSEADYKAKLDGYEISNLLKYQNPIAAHL